MITKIARYAKILPAEAKQSYQNEFAWYPNLFSWSVRVYDRVLRQAPRLPLPARKSVVRLRFRGMENPFYIRLGSSDLQLHQTIRFRGEYAPVIQNPFPRSLQQVIDLGANAGYTMRLWRELFPQARIIGVEPDPVNMALCRLNAESLPGVRLDFVQACVDGKSGSVWLDRSTSEHQFHIAEGPARSAIEVEALTVPQILERVGADEEIGFLKCDVQGAEKAIFADCASWISRVRNMVVEVHPPYTGDDLIADLKRNGWQWKRVAAKRTDNLWVLFFWGEESERGQSANAGSSSNHDTIVARESAFATAPSKSKSFA